eukprot:1320941-Amphidinium_carterae.1
MFAAVACLIEVEVQQEPDDRDSKGHLKQWTEQSTSTQHTICCLELDTTYRFAVRAVSAIGFHASAVVFAPPIESLREGACTHFSL